MAKAKILVVEDEGIVAKDIEASLNSLGYDVPAIAFSGEEAIEKAEQTHPDLALMDIVLPGAMDGIEAAEQIRSRFNIPIVYLTAYADDDTLRRAKATASCGYILKPFEDRELRANIEMALYKHGTESKLKASEKKYRHLVKSLPQIVFEMDEKGSLAFANRQASEIFGYTEQDFASGLDVLQMIAAPDRGRAREDIRRSLSGQKLGGREYTALRKDRSKVAVVVYLAPILRGDEPVGLRGIAVDITERKRIEAEERKLEQEGQAAHRLATVRQLASGVGHEINNPLTGIVGYSELLMRRKDVPLDVKGDLETIHNEGQRIATIVNKLVAFARQQKLQPDYVNINHAMATTIDLLDYQFKLSNIKVTTQLAPDLPMTIADAGQLLQVFFNLIMNAVTEMKLSRGKGNLFIETKVIDNTIRISFKDNGPGIAKKNLDRIFEPFFTTRDVGEGTGLGLSICHGIVTQHGGRIHATSELDKGATFVVELPIVTEPGNPSNWPTSLLKTLTDSEGKDTGNR